MVHLTLRGLLLGLNDLLSKRLPVLQSFPSGNSHISKLTKKRDLILALPAAYTSRPYAKELGETDVVHDGYGGSVWHFAESYLIVPNLDPKYRAAIGRIRAATVTSLEQLKASYETEADEARDQRSTLSDLKADLDLFPLAGGGTLLDWVTGKLDAGDQINDWLSKRADVESQSRGQAASLRAGSLGLLRRFRDALADDVDDDDKLPRDLDGQVFGYFDLLDKMAADRVDPEDVVAAADPAAPATPAAPPPVKGP